MSIGQQDPPYSQTIGSHFGSLQPNHPRRYDHQRLAYGDRPEVWGIDPARPGQRNGWK